MLISKHLLHNAQDTFSSTEKFLMNESYNNISLKNFNYLENYKVTKLKKQMFNFYLFNWNKYLVKKVNH